MSLAIMVNVLETASHAMILIRAPLIPAILMQDQVVARAGPLPASIHRFPAAHRSQESENNTRFVLMAQVGFFIYEEPPRNLAIPQILQYSSFMKDTRLRLSLWLKIYAGQARHFCNQALVII